MARLLLRTMVFPPDAISTARLLGDLARELRALGHSFEVVTTVPHFNPDPELERSQPLLRGTNVLGADNGLYYLVSRW